MQIRFLLIATALHGAVILGVGVGVHSWWAHPQDPPLQVALLPHVPEAALVADPVETVPVRPPAEMPDVPVREPEPAPLPRPDPAAEPEPEPESEPRPEPPFSAPVPFRASPDLLRRIKPLAAAAQPEPETPAVAAVPPVPDVPAAARDEHNRPPRYPRLAERRGVGGEVLLLVHVDAKGEVSRVELLQSAGRTRLHKSLDAAAIAAVWRWRYSPARRNGVPVSIRIEVPVEFRPRPRR